MTTIWKYPLELTDQNAVSMPLGSHLLCVAMQHGVPTLWALLNPEAVRAHRIIRIVGTGHPMPDWPGAAYIGAVQVGDFVWHVFDGGWAAPEEGAP